MASCCAGGAGDFKTATGFRLHAGGEDQAVDPLIAAAEAGLVPAHRGTAYAVFEHFQLADYGNRIPSLTFEVIGDGGEVTVGGLARAVSDGLVTGDVALPIGGFAAYGDVRSVLELLAAASGAWFAPVQAGTRAGVAMRDGLTPVRTLTDAGYGAGDAPGVRGVRSIAALEGCPRTVTVAHYDVARDYQTGLQRARRPGAGLREARLDLPASVSADLAKGIAEAELARGEAGRERRTLALGWGDLSVAPGACVAIEGAAGVYRVAKWSFEKMVVSVDCVRLAGATLPTAASAGRVLPAPDLMAGTTILHVFEILPLDDSVLSAPRLMVAAAGTEAGWRRAALLFSIDDGARWLPAGGTSGVATIGTLVSVPGTGPSTLIDQVNAFDVELAREEMTLHSGDAAALDAGVNTALVGDELLQFGQAQQIGPRRWRLSQLWRGRRGTEAAIGTQTPGGRFVLIEADAVTAIDLPLSALRTTVRVIASGIGDAEPVAAALVVRGDSVLPPAPVRLQAAMTTDGGVALTWVRRSRAGWRWADGADVPLAEEREAYRVTITSGDGAAHIVETIQPELLLSATARGTAALSIAVRQIGSYGESAATTITLAAI